MIYAYEVLNLFPVKRVSQNFIMTNMAYKLMKSLTTQMGI